MKKYFEIQHHRKSSIMEISEAIIHLKVYVGRFEQLETLALFGPPTVQ